MPDPVSVGLILAPKLIGFATAAYTAIWSDGLGKADAKALKSLLDVSGALRKAWQGRHPDAPNLDVMSRHTVLVGAAFMAAFRDQDEIFRAGLEKKDRAADINARLATGLEEPVDPAGWAELLQRGETASPVYQALRTQFANGDLFSLDQHAFTERYRLAWAQLLATKAGKPVRVAILAAPGAQGHHLRYLVAQQMVSWRAESLLGEVDKLEGAPLPLKRAYVEPATEENVPLLPTLRRWLSEDHPTTDNPLIGAVTAPFGHGKSLTARVLSSVLAEAWLADGPQSGFDLSSWWRAPDPFQPDAWFTKRPQPDRWFPEYVPCRQTGLNPSAIQTAINRALKAQLTAQGVQLSAKEIETCWPDDQQNRLIILDGLDEVHLRPDAQQALVDALSDETSARCRFLIFTRPAALPDKLRDECVIFSLRRFNEVQIDTWLTPWNACHQTDITREAIDRKGLLTLAKTPILLYMIARAWSELDQDDEAVPEVEVYEKFFNLLATTKLDMSHQPVVLKTAEQIHAALTARGLLEDDAQPEDGLLWLLARLAWTHACEQAAGRSLTRKAIERLLRTDLGIEGKLDAVFSGLMLVMRADPTHHNPPFDFSHQSFKEFLIACHWRNEVLKPAPDERMLMGARLLESKAPRFLLELLKQDPAHQEKAARWAEQCFLNPRLGWRAPKGAPDYCDDPLRDERGHLREAALMLRCDLDAEPLVLDDNRVLENLVRGLEVQGTNWLLRATRLKAGAVRLRGADLKRAHLQEASLRGADLRGADLEEADLRGADLRGVNLQGARLRGAHLQGAHLQEAQLVKADLQYADFSTANLRGANLQSANFQEARFQQACLRGAELQRSDLRWAVLQRANLDSAHLQGAHLQGAHLQGAQLQGADLDEADLKGADFTRAKLGTGKDRTRNLHLAENVERAIRPEGWGDLLSNPQT